MFKGKTPLIIAFVLAIGAAFLAWRQLKMWRTEITSGWELQKVIVAAADLQPGSPLSSEAITIDNMPRRFVYESVLVPSDMEVALGREVIVPVKRGEPLHWYQLKGIRALERLSKAVRKRARAISLSVSEGSSVGQWVRPNDHVDVLGTFRDPNSNQQVAVTLSQNVIVLATGRTNASTHTRQRDDAYGTVTLLVLPEEAEILVLAQELGTLYLSLRNPEDISIFDERARTTIKTLLTGERMKDLQRKRHQIIQVIRGFKAPKPRR